MDRISHTPNHQACEQEKSDTPALKALKVGVAAILGLALAGGIAGLDIAGTNKATTIIKVEESRTLKTQVCEAQKALEEQLGVPPQPEHLSFSGCEGAAGIVSNEIDGDYPATIQVGLEDSPLSGIWSYAELVEQRPTSDPTND